jgi:outer membrane protein
MWFSRYVGLWLILLTMSTAWAQPTRLVDLLKQAEQNYPALKAARFRTDALRKNDELIQQTALPSLDAAYGANLATYNNITGLFFPPFVLPISGPPSASNSFQPVAGSSASLLLGWQPITFGKRDAQRAVAGAEVSASEAGLGNEQFNLNVRLISAYLDQILFQQLLGVYRQNIQRAETVLTQSRVLVANGLRPASDTALLRSELSRAKVELLQAQQALQVAQINLGEFVTGTASRVQVDSLLFTRLPGLPGQRDSLSAHPAIRLAEQQIRVSESRETLIQKVRLPTLSLWATTYARGSGVSATGEVKATEGLLLTRFNYGAGLQLALPLLNGPEVRFRGQQQHLLTNAFTEELNQTRLQLTTRQQLAQSSLQNALLVARELPIQVQANQTAYSALQTRYTNGLVTLTDLAQAQYGLVRAETDLRRAYWSAWQALLQQAAATGDLSLFLIQLP